MCDVKSTRYTAMACVALYLFGYALLAAPNVDPAPAVADVEGAASTLMEIVRETKDPDAKWRAVRALGCLHYKGAVPLLLECLKDEHHYVRANAGRRHRNGATKRKRRHRRFR